MSDSTHTQTTPAAKNRGRGLLAIFSNKLLLALLGVSLLPLAVMGYAAYSSAAKAIEQQAARQLETVNTI
ncbi:MAG: hypothetical protein EBS81_12680, partial [Gammaproteobacteria bacterium]|nr:hypothetical protein [Gammaproteobacteria bacterium]